MNSYNRIISKFCYFCFLLLCASCASQQIQQVQSDVKFGLIEKNREGKWVLTQETFVIPYGKDFGYDIPLTEKGTHQVYDIVYMPSTPKTLTGLLSDNPLQVATSGAKTRPYEAEGRARNIYWFDPGDPIGQYRIDVYIDGKPRFSFKFEVVQ